MRRIQQIGEVQGLTVLFSFPADFGSCSFSHKETTVFFITFISMLLYSFLTLVIGRLQAV